MRTTRLALVGIAVRGRIGANPGERDAPQDLVVDLDVEVTVGGDDLAATADYRGLIRAARAVVEASSFDLLESLAHAIAGALVATPGVRRVTATVHKPAAARSNDVADVAAIATAEA